MRISDWSADVCSSDPPAALATFSNRASLNPFLANSMRAAEHIFSIVFVIFAFIRRSVQTLLRDNELVNDLGGLSHPLAMASVSSISRQSLRKRSEEHTSELQSLMRTSYAVFCLKKKH